MNNYWNELTKDMTEMAGKNFEVMSKYWKATTEVNENFATQNMDLFFKHMESNLDYAVTIWNNVSTGNKELAKAYTANFEKLNEKFQKVYNDTVKNTTKTTK